MSAWRKTVEYMLVIGLCLMPLRSAAQYFSRNAVQLPSLGSTLLGPSYGVTDQVQIGTGFAHDLYDLRLWWITESALGLGYANSPDAPDSRVIVSLQGSSGLKYNFSNRRWRPFVGAMFEIFAIFNGVHSPFGAFRPMAGLEWIYGDDLALEIEGGYVLLSNFENPLFHSAMVRASHRIYF